MNWYKVNFENNKPTNVELSKSFPSSFNVDYWPATPTSPRVVKWVVLEAIDKEDAKDKAVRKLNANGY